MWITLNGKNMEFLHAQNLADVVRRHCRPAHRVIAEVNGQIIKPPQWDALFLKEGDAVELVNFVGGG